MMMMTSNKKVRIAQSV